MLLIFSRWTARLAARYIEIVPSAKIKDLATASSSRSRSTPHIREQLIVVLLASVGVQVLRIVQAYYLGLGLGIAAPLAVYLAFIPLILLVMLLPVTFNGIGTSQAAFVWLFAQAGVDAAPAFALSVLFVALGIVGNLPGGFLYAVGQREPDADRVRS